MGVGGTPPLVPQYARFNNDRINAMRTIDEEPGAKARTSKAPPQKVRRPTIKMENT